MKSMSLKGIRGTSIAAAILILAILAAIIIPAAAADGTYVEASSGIVMEYGGDVASADGVIEVYDADQEGFLSRIFNDHIVVLEDDPAALG